jgi:multidrug efflux system outer membrane protein
VKARVDAGATPELALERARGELEVARADVPEAQRRRAVAAHRLAILTGSPPDRRFDASPSVAFELPPALPVGVPSALLQRRPDVRAAEERVRSANADVGAALGEFFPRVMISGSAGYLSARAETLARPTSQIWDIGPSISIPLFAGGTTYYRWQEKKALTDAAIAQYRSTVLRAFGEVADSVAGIEASREQRDRYDAAVRSSRHAVELSDAGYRQGATAYIEVLDAQRALLAARTNLLRSRRALLGALVHLEKALGGGWTELAEGSAEK